MRKGFYCAVAAIVLASTSCDLIGIPDPSQSDSQAVGEWEAFAPLAVARQEIGVAELGGKIYVLGGIAASRASSNTLEIFDPETEAWSGGAPLPASLHHIAVVAVNGQIYSIGGYTSGFGPVNSVYAYDPDDNTWAQKASLPRALGSPAAAVIDGIIYVAGGVADDGQRSSFFSYDPASNTWTALPALPTPRDHLAAAAIDGKFYAVGGRNSASFTLSVLEVFDPASNTWAQLAEMPTGRSGIAAGVVRGCLYVFGGEGNDRNINRFGVFPENELYDPITNDWQTMAPMELARHGIGAAVVEEKIHIPGGAPVEGFSVTDTHDAFVPPADVSCE